LFSPFYEDLPSEMNDNNAPAPRNNQILLQDQIRRNNARYHATQMRRIELDRYGIQYVLDRDAKLEGQGLDPLLDAAEYERKKQEKQELLRQFELKSKSFFGPGLGDSTPSGPKPVESPNGDRIEKLLETESVTDVISKLISNYDLEDFPPMFPDIAYCDPDDVDMQKLNDEFDRELRELAIDFLKRHADKVTKKALIGFARGSGSDPTFDKMFGKDI
jgi:hypothetical protein